MRFNSLQLSPIPLLLPSIPYFDTLASATVRYTRLSSFSLLNEFIDLEFSILDSRLNSTSLL